MKSYPVGATILLCEYEYYGKTEEVRVVLPAHIFKMMKFKPRDSQFNNPTRKTVLVERKIGHNIKALKEIFKGASVEENSIRSTIYHEHTETKMIFDLSAQKAPATFCCTRPQLQPTGPPESVREACCIRQR